MKKLPIGIQNIEKLITEDYLYIDKTKFIYELIQTGSVYFLSRPRRFGKSLLISTLEAIFQGKKELFEGLWIHSQADFKWKSYPVIRLDLSQVPTQTSDSLVEGLKMLLQKIAASYQVKIDDTYIKMMFIDLIEKLSAIGKVVVLIDEYDKPIIDNILNQKIAIENRDILKSFYGILKGQDQNLKFIFLTGISTFSKVSVFSDLNHLSEISMVDKYASLLGYTQSELELYFKSHIQLLSQDLNQSVEKTLSNIKLWYNGYQFSKRGESVYNPFSTLRLFDTQDFRPYWFETATPSFLVNLIKEKRYDFTKNDYYRAEESQFSTYEVDSLQILPLLVQTGYLTIQSYNNEFREYLLGYPNFEVKDGFVNYLAKSLVESHISLMERLRELRSAIHENQIELFMKTLQTIFAKIPYDIQLPHEKYYQSLWYLIFTLLGLRINAEQRTNQGRIDGIIETKDHIYIFEFKLDQPAIVALQQIQDKDYAQGYQDCGKPITLIGVAFDSKTRNISEWLTT